jgi:hypothetical protein
MLLSLSNDIKGLYPLGHSLKWARLDGVDFVAADWKHMGDHAESSSSSFRTNYLQSLEFNTTYAFTCPESGATGYEGKATMKQEDKLEEMMNMEMT